MRGKSYSVVIFTAVLKSAFLLHEIDCQTETVGWLFIQYKGMTPMSCSGAARKEVCRTTVY